MGPLVPETEEAAEGAEVVAGGQREQDPRQLQGVDGPPPAEGGGEKLAAEGEVEGRPVADQVRALAEAGELGHRLDRRRLAGEVGGGDPGEALDRERHRDAGVDEELELAEALAAHSETDRTDLDHPLALRREPGGLEVEGDELGGHHAAGGGTDR